MLPKFALRFTGIISARPVLSQITLNVVIASYVLALLNLGFWTRLFAQFPQAPIKAVIFGIGVWALTVMLLELLGPSRLQKPVAAVLILIAASAQYYERSFGVLIDREMVRSILETTVTESRHLITWRMIGTILLTGGVPAALVFWPKVRRASALHQLWRWPLGVALPAVVVLAAVFSHYKDYSAMLRERHDMMGAYQPGASLVALTNYLREEWKSADPTAAPVGQDATPGPYLAAAPKPVLLVMVVGETARAQNFGLNGYVRNTTPQLRARGVINFTDAHSCGTSTAVSVPCMFSPLGKAEYSRDAFLRHENLLDVLAHAGVKTEWWDNNTGDQNVAKRVGWNRVDAVLAPNACQIECTDEAFLPVIAKVLAQIQENTVLILHSIGSHGPSYYLRYDPKNAQFQPDCRSSQFSDCTAEEITNAYDNSILETDRVLARVIDLLAASDRVLPALVYVSDHGESLGESGLYLHAAPAFMAPPEQTRVPFLMWLSPTFGDAMGVHAACLQGRTDKPVSHDNLFHSVLGLMNIETGARNHALDLTADCPAKEMI